MERRLNRMVRIDEAILLHNNIMENFKKRAMTHQDYINKKIEMNVLSRQRFLTVEEDARLLDLVLDISLYEANNGMVDENEFKNK